MSFIELGGVAGALAVAYKASEQDPCKGTKEQRAKLKNALNSLSKHFKHKPVSDALRSIADSEQAVLKQLDELVAALRPQKLEVEDDDVNTLEAALKTRPLAQ